MLLISLLFLFLPAGSSSSSASSSPPAQWNLDIYNDITDKYPGLDPNGFFCSDGGALTDHCSNYIDSLNQMLTSCSSMMATSPFHIAAPVRPVLVPFKAVVDPTPEISDVDVAQAFKIFSDHDTNAADQAMAALSSSAATKEMSELSTVVALEISNLRTALGLFVDQAYEGTYLDFQMPLPTLAPIVRAIGSLFQRLLFNWQLGNNANSMDFYTKRLLVSEKNYMEYFFELYGYEQYNFHFGLWYGNRMSSFTWSHRSRHAESEDSIRFACGTTSQEEPFAMMGLQVLEERSIDLSMEFDMTSDDLTFYGLGWDLEANNFKVYLMFHNFDTLPDKYKALANTTLHGIGIELKSVDLGKHGLISLTYNDKTYEGDKVEEKSEQNDGEQNDGEQNDGEQHDGEQHDGEQHDGEQHSDEQDSEHSDGSGLDGSGSNCDGDVLAYYDPKSSTNSNHECSLFHHLSKALTLHEEKIYLYPTVEEAYRQQDKHHIKPLDGTSTSNVAWLLASKRGFVPQFDAVITPDSEAVWRKRLGAKGKHMIDKYQNIHLQLETIAYHSKDDWTIYFPAGSG